MAGHLGDTRSIWPETWRGRVSGRLVRSIPFATGLGLHQIWCSAVSDGRRFHPFCAIPSHRRPGPDAVER